MLDYLRRPVAHEAFFKKYASKKFLKGKPLDPDCGCSMPMYSSIDPYPSMGEEERLDIPRYHSYLQPAQWQKHSQPVVMIYNLFVLGPSYAVFLWPAINIERRRMSHLVPFIVRVIMGT